MSRAQGCPDAVTVVLASERRDTRRPLLDHLESGPPAVREVVTVGSPSKRSVGEEG